MLDEHSPVLFSSAFAPSGLQTVTAFEVVWKKGERREEGMEGEGREGGGREEWTTGVPSIEADEAAASSLSE